MSTVGRTFGSFDLCCVWQNICRDKSDGNSFHYCLSCYHRPFQYFRSDVTCDTGGVINNSNNYGNNVLFEEKKNKCKTGRNPSELRVKDNFFPFILLSVCLFSFKFGYFSSFYC